MSVVCTSSTTAFGSLFTKPSWSCFKVIGESLYALDNDVKVACGAKSMPSCAFSSWFTLASVVAYAFEIIAAAWSLREFLFLFFDVVLASSSPFVFSSPFRSPSSTVISDDVAFTVNCLSNLSSFLPLAHLFFIFTKSSPMPFSNSFL